MGASIGSTTLRTAVRVARLWTRVYTLGMPAELRAARLTEIESDLWECQHDPGRPARPAEMIARVLLGIPDDILWRMEQSAEAKTQAAMHVPRSVTASAFTCSLAVHLIFLAGIAWWASWPAERARARVWTSHRPLAVNQPPLLVDAPAEIPERELPIEMRQPSPAVVHSYQSKFFTGGVFVTPVSGLSRQPIHLPGTWMLDPSRTDPDHDWEATVPAGDPPPPPPPGPDSLRITRKGTDLVIEQRFNGGSPSTTCELVDADTFSLRSRQTMSAIPSTNAFWDGTLAIIRMTVALHLPRDATMPVELRTRFSADETTLILNHETRMPNGVYTRRFVYSRQN